MPRQRSMKTSGSDPLRVDFIDAEALGLAGLGRLGLTIAPGKKDPARQWDRDLDADLDRLRSVHRAHLLVSLMEEHEYAMLEIPALRDRATAAGLEVVWFPIEDVSVPARAELGAFTRFIAGLTTALRGGKTVVVHCRGGLGRSGTVAACCLVGLGIPSSDAIGATRAARPGAIETSAQEAWVHAFGAHARRAASSPRRADPPAPAPRSRETVRPPTLDAYRGCLLGGGLGDALGYPVEFLKHPEIVRRYGAATPARLTFDGAPLARISDDTQMTLFTAEGLLRALTRARGKRISHAPTLVGFAYLRWYETQGGQVAHAVGERGWLVEDRRLHASRAPGNTCLSALGALARRKPGEIFTVEERPNDSKGCGAVMRAAPCGLAAASREEAFALGRDTGVLTHGHPSGYLSAAYVAALIWDLVRGAALPDAMAGADALLAEEDGAAELQAILAKTRLLAARGVPSAAALEALGGGWTGEEALAIALLCVLTFDHDAEAIPDVLWRAAAHGGDSDSTAAIAGNLLGAMHGVQRLPARWLEELELRDVIERLASDLFGAFVEGDDVPGYPGN